MIIFNILFTEEKKAEEISSFIIKNNYAVQTHVDTNKVIGTNGKQTNIRLFFITKALLYNNIESDILKQFPTESLIIYATPVSHINESYYEIIKNKIKAV